jgi:hypothetical protein
MKFNLFVRVTNIKYCPHRARYKSSDSGARRVKEVGVEFWLGHVTPVLLDDILHLYLSSHMRGMVRVEFQPSPGGNIQGRLADQWTQRLKRYNRPVNQGNGQRHPTNVKNFRR